MTVPEPNIPRPLPRDVSPPSNTAPGEIPAAVNTKSDICTTPLSPFFPTWIMRRGFWASANLAPDAESCVHASPTSWLLGGMKRVSVSR